MSGERKLVRSKSGLRMVSVDERRPSPFELSEPAWDVDKHFVQCVKCGVTFDFLTRRHHCRRCGQIFCSRCCDVKMALPRMCFLDPVRQCASCANVTRKENEFFEKHLKILLNGADLTCEQNEEKNVYLFCKLSSDHRFIVFDGETKHEPLSVSSIKKTQILRQLEGQTIASGIEISYTDTDNQLRKLRFRAAAQTSDKSNAWFTSLNKNRSSKMEHQLHFKLTLQLTRDDHEGPAYFKVDGSRFKTPRTIKLHSDSSYTFRITSRPPQTLESLSVHGTSLALAETSRDHTECVHSAVWSTAGFSPTRKGEREQVPIIIKIGEKGTLKACLQTKMYRAEDEQHCAWGSSLHSIEWECNANEHRNHVDVAKETFH